MLRARDIPNAISILRMLLVPAVVYLLLNREFRWAMALFFVAGVSDALDGFLARHFDWRSRLGGLLDPLADKFLLISVFVCLAWLGVLPWWLTALVILRDLVILGGALAYHFTVERLEAEPSLLSKLNTALQILLVLAVVWDLGFGPLPPLLLQAMVWAVTFTLVASGLDYVLEWSRRATARRR